jgi:RNA polymerase sigma-70 factor (ECF subfamily)
MMHHVHDSKTQNEAQVAALYERYAPIILTYLRQNRITKEDAEDLLVEVFLAAMESTALLNLQEGAQLAWLRRVAHNKLIDHLRRVARRPVVDLEGIAELLHDDDHRMPEQMALQREDHDWLRARLATLPIQQQEVLRLRFADGLRSQEIGQRLNKSDSAVRMLLSRAMSFLRSMYDQQKGGNAHEK